MAIIRWPGFNANQPIIMESAVGRKYKLTMIVYETDGNPL
jgi:hypothetical protein